jgi:hypothetical protein
MKLYTHEVTERIGEWLGPVDYSYNWGKYHELSDYRTKKIEVLRQIEILFRQGVRINVWYDPILCGEVLEVGMYDGWPFWEPTPALLLKHWYAPEVHFWYDIGSFDIIPDVKE